MTITLDFPEPCPECNPDDAVGYGNLDCDICNGLGYVPESVARELLYLDDLEENEDDE
jgi:hypothetical protein